MNEPRVAPYPYAGQRPEMVQIVNQASMSAQAAALKFGQVGGGLLCFGLPFQDNVLLARGIALSLAIGTPRLTHSIEGHIPAHDAGVFLPGCTKGAHAGSQQLAGREACKCLDGWRFPEKGNRRVFKRARNSLLVAGGNDTGRHRHASVADFDL